MNHRPQLARFARSRRRLSGVAVPTQTLLPGASIRPEDVSTQRFTGAERERHAANLRAAIEPVLADARERAAMFGWDKSWAKEARWTDARMCLGRDDVVPYVPGECGGDPICNWGFYQVQVPCDKPTFQRVQFQWARYEWAQRQLAFHLANQPPRTPANARRWVNWTLEVFRLVSLARWCMNISEDYYPLGERTQAKMAEINAALHPSFRTPAKVHADDVGAAKNRSCMSLWMPKNFNNLRRRDPLPIPQHSFAFEPVRQFTFDTAVAIGGSMSGNVVGTWPWRWIPRSPGSGLIEQMTAWYELTLAGSAYWYSSGQTPIEYLTRRDCGVSAAAANYCTKRTVTNFSWGTALATIDIAVAMAEDVVNQTWGQLVSAGLQSWLEQYLALPPALQILGPEAADLVRGAADDVLRMATHGASALLTLLGSASMGFTTVVAAVLSALTELLILFKANAIGGGVLESACLSCPIIRSIPTPDVEGLIACDFDTRTAGRDAEALVRVIGRLDAVRGAAAAGLPVSAWLEASRNAERGNIGELLVPPPFLPPPDGESTPWFGFAVAGAVLVGGVLLLRR